MEVAIEHRPYGGLSVKADVDCSTLLCGGFSFRSLARFWHCALSRAIIDGRFLCPRKFLRRSICKDPVNQKRGVSHSSDNDSQSDHRSQRRSARNSKMTDQERERLEIAACTPVPVNPAKFNRDAQIPYGLTPEHIRQAMEDFVGFLGFIDQQLRTRGIERLESMLMPANFSSIVGEFMSSRIPKFCPSIVRNTYHNGHPDLIPAGVFPNNSVLHDTRGIEIKASRYARGWQGHNAEAVWLMVFVFECNSSSERAKDVPPKPFRFMRVVGAQLEMEDWQFSGRSATSRRTITASVKRAGYDKMMANWIYDDGLSPGAEARPAEESPLSDAEG